MRLAPAAFGCGIEIDLDLIGAMVDFTIDSATFVFDLEQEKPGESNSRWLHSWLHSWLQSWLHNLLHLEQPRSGESTEPLE